MKKALNLCLAMVMAAGLTHSHAGNTNGEPSQGTAQRSIPKIIFDTDMGPDYDDIGAIAVLHALADRGECEILATVSSDGHPMIAPTIEVYNRYYNRPHLPVGNPLPGAPDFTAANNWNDLIVDEFAPDLRGKTYPTAVSVYRQVLAAQPDNSVTIVTVGFTSNVSDLLNSKADEHSNLNGVELVKKKVKHWVAMAGSLPGGQEFNVFEAAKASVNAFTNFPKPILFSSFEIGYRIFTGGEVAKLDGTKNPVARGYAFNLQTYTKDGETARPSWDQATVLIAIRNPEDYFYVNGPGKFIINQDGTNSWDPTIDAGHRFLVHKYPFQHIANVLEELMKHEP